jgi:hypothetical protein
MASNRTAFACRSASTSDFAGMDVARRSLRQSRSVMRQQSRRPKTSPAINPAIRLIRGERVILDYDLAELYGVETKALNRATKRNARKFPADFLFQLTAKEAAALRCQSGTSNSNKSRARFA